MNSSNGSNSVPNVSSSEEIKGRNLIFHHNGIDKEANTRASGFIEYVVHPQKIDSLIEKIDSYSKTNSAIAEKIDKYADKIDKYAESNSVIATKLDSVIDQIAKSNDNQSKTLSLLTTMVQSLVEKNNK